MVTELSAAQARELALTAQGLAQPRPARVDKRALRAMVERLGVVQIDSVNVLVRSHYLPAFSRLGAYDVTQLDALAHRAPRALFEFWGHEASLLPVALHPLLRWRMARAKDHAWGRMRRIAKKNPRFVDEVLAIVAEKGPLSAGELEPGDGRGRIHSGPWGRPRSSAAAGGSGPMQRRRSSGCSGAVRSRVRGGVASSGSTICPSACCRRG